MDVVELTGELVAINSQNPGPGENGIAGFVETVARGLGVTAQRFEPVAGRPNVLLTHESRYRDFRRCLQRDLAR